MANAVVMPKVGISVESCLLTEWLKQPGDSVAVGEALFNIETDKASMECESTEAGTLLEQFFQAGDEVPVLVNVCAIGTPGEDVSTLRPDGAAAEADAPTPTAAETPATAPVQAQIESAPIEIGGDLRISPRAKALAQSQHVDPRLAAPTGPYGRIIERDVRALAATGQAATGAAAGAMLGAQPGTFAGTGIGGRVSLEDLAAPLTSAPASPSVSAPVAVSGDDSYEDVNFTTIRKVIAKSMGDSLRTIPQLTHNFSFDASELMAYRAKLKNSPDPDLAGVTLGDMVMFATSRLLPSYPDLNAHMVGETTIRHFRDVHLAFACDTERGLVVPVIRSANRKSLVELSKEIKELAAKAQTGNLSPDLMSGGSFTVSNLGGFAVENFTPVINPPQTGILGVGTILQRPYEKDGQIKLYPAMGLSLTYDHRAIDGAPASRFAKELCGLLANFTLMLAK